MAATGLTAFTTYGQWDTTLANPSLLAIYAPQNPVTEWGTIYVTAQNTNEGIRTNSGANNVLIENLNFRFCSRGFNSRQGAVDITVQDCVFEFCYDGMAIGNTDGLIFQRNDIYTSGRTGIVPSNSAFTNTKPSYIRNNTVTDGGYAEGIGLLYGAAAMPSFQAGLYVQENIFNRCHAGVYWANENFGLYAENTCAYWVIERNLVMNQRDAIDGKAAYHANGGLHCRWVSNICYNCQVGFNGSDALPVDNVQSELYHNVFIEVDTAFTFSRKPLVSGEVFTYKIYNNIATPNPDTITSYAVIVDPDVDDLDTMFIDYNLFYNFDVNLARLPSGTLNTEFGANNITDQDPLLSDDGDYFPAPNSPVHYAGVWIGKFLKDHGGRPFGAKPNIGAWATTSRDPVSSNAFTIQHNPISGWNPITGDGGGRGNRYNPEDFQNNPPN